MAFHFFYSHIYQPIPTSTSSQVLEDAARKAEEEHKRAVAAAEAAAARDRANYARQQLSLENATVTDERVKLDVMHGSIFGSQREVRTSFSLTGSHCFFL